MVRHFTRLLDLSEEDAQLLADRALALKHEGPLGHRSNRLAGRTLGLLFEKPSLRTRVSFEAAFAQLGGSSIFLPAKDVGLGVRETVADFARVLSQYVDALAVRTFAQETIEELARHASIPVINALSDFAHPCQAMADLVTVQESFGRTQGIQIVFVGDGNNVARSVAVACALLGARFRLCSPPGYDFDADFRARFAERFPRRPLEVSHDPASAVVDAEVVYTDVWTSMGQEDEAEARRAVFEPFRVDDRLMARARPNAVFLHCLPAHRGEEVTDCVLEGERSLVIAQAANRLHFQKALLLWLLEQPAVAVTPGDARPGHGQAPPRRRSRRTG
jgi:ornithine carbamoyltransferase